MPADLVEVGYVARAHGVTGELRLVLHNPESSVLETASRLFIGVAPYDVQAWRQANKGYLVRLAGVGDRDAAEALRGRAVHAARGELELDEDEVLLADFVGCDVFLEDGTPWGRIAQVQLGLQELLVVHDGGMERLVPLVPEFVLEIDVDQKRVTLAPPEGLPETEIDD